MDANSPYSGLPDRAFWRQAVAERPVGDAGDVYEPRFRVTTSDRIATAGSCFAQHVGRTLRENGFSVIDVEPIPAEVEAATAQRFGFGLFSARYGNIYTVRQLAQLIDEAQGAFSPALPVWEKDGRFYDAQRPGVEPEGMETPEAVMEMRAFHLARVLDMLSQTDVFVFTFGLTESWVHRETGTVYPTAPGTIAGTYDPKVFAFKNYGFAEILNDFLYVRSKLKAINPAMRFVVTVSPVPLTATASGQHVEVATAYSKAVLRAVAGELYRTLDDLDYFPSFEIITSQRVGGRYYEANLRSVSAVGVSRAMSVFMAAQGVEIRFKRLQELPRGGRADGDARPAATGPRDARQREARLRAAAPPVRSPESATGPIQLTREERLALRQHRDALLAARHTATEQDPGTASQLSKDDVICEDALLEAFRK